MEEMCGALVRAEGFHALSGHVTIQGPQWDHQPGSSTNLIILGWVLCGGFIP